MLWVRKIVENSGYLHFGFVEESILPTTVYLPLVLVVTAVGILALSYSKTFPVCSNLQSWVVGNVQSIRERVQGDVYRLSAEKNDDQFQHKYLL